MGRTSHILQQVMEMERKKTGYPPKETDRRLPALGLAALLGALGGSLLCAQWPRLQEILFNGGQAPAVFWQALWPDLILLALMMLSGFLRAGCLTALLTAAVKGFLLSALSTFFVLEKGSGGYAQVLCAALLPGFLTLSALLLQGRQAMGLSLARLSSPPGKGRRVLPDSAYFFTFLICFGLILLSAALTVWLSPKLWTAAQTFLPNL